MTPVLFVASAVVIVDQFTKALALTNLAPGIPVSLVDGFLSLTLVRNTGLAFGLLGGLPPAWRWVVAGLSITALLILARVALRVMARGGRLDDLAIGLIFGGALGNLIDRARFQAVIDFIDVHAHGYHWPAFNAADSAITVGVTLLALRLFTKPAAPVAD